MGHGYAVESYTVSAVSGDESHAPSESVSCLFISKQLVFHCPPEGRKSCKRPVCTRMVMGCLRACMCLNTV